MAAKVPTLQSIRLRLLEGFLDRCHRAAAPRIARHPQHLATGRRGERAALFHLRMLGYTVVAHGWRSGRAPGDLDLIAWDRDILCFVEVKARTTRDVATAEAAVDEHKRRTLRRLARLYVRQLPDANVPARFDILSVYLEEGKPPAFEHFISAFDWR